MFRIRGKNRDAREAYDFETGDVFHFKYEDTFCVYDYGDSTYKILSGDIGSKIRTVLSRIDYADSVTCQYSECAKVKRYSNGVPETIYLSDTTNETIIYDSSLFQDNLSSSRIVHRDFSSAILFHLFPD